MAGFSLRKNMVFEWNGASFRIDRLQPGGDVLIEAMESGALSFATRKQLLEEFARGRIAASPISTKAEPHSFSRPLEDLPENMRKEFHRRRRYLQAMTQDGTPIFTKEFLRPIIDQVAKELEDPKPPSPTSLYRWYKRHTSTSGPRALIPRLDLRGGSCRQSPLVMTLLTEATAEAFSTSPAASGENIYSRLLAKIDAANRQLLNSTPLRAPSKRTMYRLLRRTDAYEMTLLKEGPASADRRFRVGKLGTRTTRILQRVEMDHTPLDLFLVDEHTWIPLGRPTLTVAIDHYSRMLLGYFLSFEGPSAAAVVGALRHAILPKQTPELVLPELSIVNSWPCYGIPEQLVLDNGLEFHGIDLDAIAIDLEFSLAFCPKRQPRFKGTVERYLKTVNYSFAHQLPGMSYAHFHKRGDYDPLKHALLTMSEFKQLFEKWVIDVYAQEMHSGIRTTPWQRWHEGLAAYEPQLPANVEMLQRIIGKSAFRKLRRDGFELNGIRYNGNAAEPILRAYGEGVTVRVVYDPEDLASVQLWGPHDVDPVTIQALDLDYARGLTQRQNKLIRTHMRETGTQADHSALQRAREEMTRAVSELMMSRKQKARQRSAAIRSVSSRSPKGSLQLTGETRTGDVTTKTPTPARAAELQNDSSDSLTLIRPFQMTRN